MSDEPQWGTYTVLLDCAPTTTITVGALGDHQFDAGVYAYTGSACGTGGYTRLDRHRRTACGENDTLHWHIDYLLHDDATEIRDIVTAPGYDIECAVAQNIDADVVAGFGASDCSCSGHLHFASDSDELESAVWQAHTAAMNNESILD